MPSLREHTEDIPQMVSAMVEEMNRKHGRRVAGVTAAAQQMLMEHSWRGNGRELRNLMERAVILAPETGVIGVEHLPSELRSPVASRPVESAEHGISLAVGTTVAEAERRLILETLEATANNKTRAAQVLGVSLKTLHNKLKEYAIPRASEG